MKGIVSGRTIGRGELARECPAPCLGYSFRTAAENTGRGFASGRRAVEWWMNSPKHRDNILLRKAREVGVGIAVSPAPSLSVHASSALAPPIRGRPATTNRT